MSKYWVIIEGMNDGTELRDIRIKLEMTMANFADAIGVGRSRYKNWEYGVVDKIPSEPLNRARALLKGSNVSRPTIPAGQLLVPVPYVGLVAASSKVDWTDPLESETFEYVPPEMADIRGRFSCRVVGDSMYPLLIPDDLCVFQASNIPKLGIIVLHKSPENTITVKALKHDGTNFILHPLNSEYQDEIAMGEVIGHLVGIVREQGSRKTTEYDHTGIRP